MMKTHQIVKEITTCSKGLSAVLCATEIFLGLTAFFRVYALARLINDVTLPRSISDPRLLSSIALFFLSICSENILTRLKDLSAVYFRCRLTERFSPAFLRKIASVPYHTYENAALHDRIKRIHPIEQTASGTYLAYTAVLRHFISLASMCYFFASMSPLLLICVIILFAVSLMYNYREMQQMRTTQIKQSMSERQAQYVSGLMSSRISLKEIHLYRIGTYLIDLWRDKQEDMITERIAVRKKGYDGSVISQACNLAFILISVCMMCWLAMSGEANVPLFISLITALPGFALLASWYIPNSLGECHAFTLLWDDYFNIMKLDSVESRTRDQRKQLLDEKTPPLKEIEFKGVDFAYPNSDTPVLKDISIHIRADENTAIVGANGSGKTTLVKLLIGLYKPLRGQILINGRDIGTYTRTELRKFFSPIFQDFMIYSQSVDENIRISLSEKEGPITAMDAAKICGADAVIKGFPHGYEQRLGKLDKDAIEPSGGEAQLLALSRAYHQDSDMLILDEPTAALDPIAESIQYERFLNMIERRGSIIISHRLASARLADRILVLSDGEIHQDGTHASLMSEAGLYASMYAAQADLYSGKI